MTILFDLDGTLLPMDMDEFVKGYFKLLAKKAAPHGYAPDKLIDAVWSGTKAMIVNDGSRTNEDAFWARFAEIFGEGAIRDKALFEDFYRNEFDGARACCGFDPEAAPAVRKVKAMGHRVALATNPIFPEIAMHKRVRWAGLEPDEFEMITTYENTGCGKPNPRYYLDVAARMGVAPEDCLMVGNDVDEDMVARDVGMDVFLLTGSLLNRSGRDINDFPHGGFGDLLEYIASKD